MHLLSAKLWFGIVVAACIAWAVGNSYLAVYAPTNVSASNGCGAGNFEPSSVSPIASGSTWVHSWYSYGCNAGFTAAWNPNTQAWLPSAGILEPSGAQVGDLFTAYDPVHNQYLLVASGLESTTSSAYFATSPDGRSWTSLRPVLSSSNGSFDYSSVAVDSTGRIIVGAVLYQNIQDTTRTWGYYVNVSADGGTTWSGMTQVIAPPGPQVASGNADTSRWGINARVVAAGSYFYIFLPALATGSQFAPLAVYYYMENGAGSWSGWNLVRDFSFSVPDNNSSYYPQMQGYIYYAPLIDASGSSSGTWAVSFQEKTGGGGGYNNVWVCTNTRGCGAVNDYSSVEFMNGVNVDTLGGTWISYLLFPQPSQTPLYHQTIYIPAPGTVCGSGSCGTTGDSSVDPGSWLSLGGADRCGLTGNCFAMGDYARIGSNGPNLGLDAPYVKYDSSFQSRLFQLFYQDPQGPPPPQNTFTPKQAFFPLGAREQIGGTPRPGYALGVAPEKRRKMPGFNH